MGQWEWVAPNLTTRMTTFHFGSTPKLFLWSLQTFSVTRGSTGF